MPCKLLQVSGVLSTFSSTSTGITFLSQLPKIKYFYRSVPKKSIVVLTTTRLRILALGEQVVEGWEVHRTGSGSWPLADPCICGADHAIYITRDLISINY
jgi:hypothetical protein